MGASSGGKLVFTLYHLARSIKIICKLTSAAKEKNKPIVRSVVVQSRTLGHFYCATAEDASQILAACKGDVVLERDEGLGCLCLVSPPTFGRTAYGVGKVTDTDSPWKHASTAFYFIAKETDITAAFDALASYLSSCRDIHCPPPNSWPATFNSDEMEQYRLTAEASHLQVEVEASDRWIIIANRSVLNTWHVLLLTGPHSIAKQKSHWNLTRQGRESPRWCSEEIFELFAWISPKLRISIV